MAFPTIPTVAAGRVLFSLNTNPAGTHTFPSLSGLTKNAGDLLIAIVIIYDGNSTNAEFSSWGASFVELATGGDNAGTATMGIGVASKVSNGGETGTFTVVSADTSANDSCCILLSIPGAENPPEAGSFATGTAAAADPASFNPPGIGTEDILWIAVGGAGEVSTTGSWTGIASAPANFTDYADSGLSADVAGAVEGAVAFRQLNAASLDVGTFSVDTSNARNAALVIAVRPAFPTGTGAISVPSATVAGVGEEVFTSTGAIAVPSATVAGVAEEIFTSTGAISVPAATLAGVGAEIFTATGAIAVPAITIGGTGDHTGGIVEHTGTGSIVVPAATLAGTGEEIFTATGAVAVPAPAVAGVGAEVFTGTGVVVAQPPLVAGTGLETFTATGALIGQPPVVAGAGLHIEAATGTGALAVPSALIDGLGLHAAPPGTGGGPLVRRLPVRVQPEVRKPDDEEAWWWD